MGVGGFTHVPQSWPGGVQGAQQSPPPVFPSFCKNKKVILTYFQFHIMKPEVVSDQEFYTYKGLGSPAEGSK